MSDQLTAGDFSLIETKPEESEAAKTRLDNHRKKHRDKMKRLYDKDPEKFRSKNREARRKAHA